MPPRDPATTFSLRRWLQRPGRLGALLVAATLAVAGALAYQAARASAAHRASVEATLKHHAATAAWHFARAARGWVSYGISEAGNKLQNEITRRNTFPGPEILTELLAEKYCDCVTAAFGRTFMRFDVQRDGALDVMGEPLSLRAHDELIEAMRRFAADTLMLGERRWQMLPPGSPRLTRATDVAILWLIRRGAGRERAVYGMIVERAQIERPLIGAHGDAEFFPPALVSKAAADSLVRIEVSGSNRALFYAVGPADHQYTGTDTLGAALGGLVAYASINPAAAQMLIVGGVPRSRLPLIIALLLVLLAMAGTAEILRRREFRLARLREDFVSGVSHELRTPLTQIRMLSELLAKDGFKSVAERERAIGIVHRESLRLTNLVDNILDFTRLRRSALTRDHEQFAPAVVLRETFDVLGPLLDAARNRIELTVDEDAQMRGDRDALSRVIRNLAENAVKYGPAGQTIRVTLARGEVSGRLRVTVDDQGPGIPAGERPRIWQPYYRLDRDRNAAMGGSGLGLSVVADLVRTLGGNVDVGDAPGGGARFTIDLPVAP